MIIIRGHGVATNNVRAIFLSFSLRPPSFSEREYFWQSKTTQSSLVHQVTPDISKNPFMSIYLGPYDDILAIWFVAIVHILARIFSCEYFWQHLVSSNHLFHVFKAVPNAIIKRLAQLTSLTATNSNPTIDELYLDHAEALKVAGLNPRKYLTLTEAHGKIRKAERANVTGKVNPYNSPEVIERKEKQIKNAKQRKDQTV